MICISLVSPNACTTSYYRHVRIGGDASNGSSTSAAETAEIQAILPYLTIITERESIRRKTRYIMLEETRSALVKKHFYFVNGALLWLSLYGGT